MTAAMLSEDSFWDAPETVERFAARDPDRRLGELLDSFTSPSETRVLDIGCAGGRNTVTLAELGFDVVAVDSSAAMVARTRDRVAAFLGAEEAERRVRVGRMEDLSFLPTGSFDLVVALGVFHQARCRAQWNGALRETARVAREGARVLVAVWSPRSRPEGVPLVPVSGESDVFVGFRSGRHYLLGAEDLDSAMGRVGLYPHVRTEEVEVPTDAGMRVTVNGLYRKRQAGFAKTDA